MGKFGGWQGDEDARNRAYREKHRTNSGIDRYASNATKNPVLSKEDELELARKYRAGSKAAGQKLVVANLRYALKVANRYSRMGFDLEDLVQEANEALLVALGRFDPDRGFRFVTYATWWIRARLNKYCTTHGSIVQFGTVYSDKIDGTIRRLRKDGATDDECLELASIELGIDMDRVRFIRDRRSADVSLDNLVAPHDGSMSATFVDLMPSPTMNPEEAVLEKEKQETITETVYDAITSPRERLIVDKRILQANPQTLSQLGDRIGVSRERVRQIEARFKRKLVPDLEDVG